MGCYNCANLDAKNKKAGKVSGNLYYCKKNKTYVNAATFSCDKWEKCYSRKSYQNDEIYDDSKSYYNDTTNPKLLLAIFLILLVLAIILGIFKTLK